MMGSWLSSALHSTGNWIVGQGNSPGTPETRKYGYDRAEVATAVVKQLEAAPPVTANPQGQLMLAGAAALGLLVLFRHKKA